MSDFVPQAHAEAYTINTGSVQQLSATTKDAADSGVSSMVALFAVLIPLMIWAFFKSTVRSHMHS